MNEETIRDIFGAILGYREPSDTERALRVVLEYANSLNWGDTEEPKPKKKKKKDKEQDNYLDRIGYDE